MQRPAVKKKANNLNDPLAIKLYKKQRNYVVNLCRKSKKDYFQKHMPQGSFSKTFWKFCKPLLIKSQILKTKLCWWKTKR